MVDRNKIEKMYREGYNASQIAKSIGSTKVAIQKYIQRNFSHLKNIHEEAVVVRKGAMKALNYESNRFISDRSFILKNRSIYKTKENGDIVLNRAVAPVVTYDTPRALRNENDPAKLF